MKYYVLTVTDSTNAVRKFHIETITECRDKIAELKIQLEKYDAEIVRVSITLKEVEQ